MLYACTLYWYGHNSSVNKDSDLINDNMHPVPFYSQEAISSIESFKKEQKGNKTQCMETPTLYRAWNNVTPLPNQAIFNILPL